MNKSKNYNSIVFLTTLSVYLGLVLVGGATPSVLAQAALTRDFDIKNEIVFEDDLDKKPDDEKIDFDGSLRRYFHQVHNFVNELQKLNQSQKFDLDLDKFESANQIFLNCEAPDYIYPSISTKNTEFRWIYFALWDAHANIGCGGDWSSWLQDKESNSSATNSKLKLSYDKTELRFEISAPKLNKQKADFFAESFNRAYKDYKIDEEKPVVKIIYENTLIKSENNQVFIITRLPRGSLDTLLAEKDAQ